jgi:large subunit ribosomal protein L10
MNPDKQIIIDELLAQISASPFLFVVDYSGMTVPEFAQLRERLDQVGAVCHVSKNTYVREAANQQGLPDFSSYLKGQTAIVTGDEDAPGAAKAIKEFNKTAKKGSPKVGVLDGDLLDESQINALADLPSRDELLATLLNVINAPASKLVRTINEPAASLARVLQAKSDKG